MSTKLVHYVVIFKWDDGLETVHAVLSQSRQRALDACKKSAFQSWPGSHAIVASRIEHLYIPLKANEPIHLFTL